MLFWFLCGLNWNVILSQVWYQLIIIHDLVFKCGQCDLFQMWPDLMWFCFVCFLPREVFERVCVLVYPKYIYTGSYDIDLSTLD